MLAEAEKPELLKTAFDADYASQYFHLFTQIAKGQAPLAQIDVLERTDEANYPDGSRRMMFSLSYASYASRPRLASETVLSGNREFSPYPMCPNHNF